MLKSEGITIIMISHDAKSALGCADKILHLEHSQSGGGYFFGTVADYNKNYIKGKEE